MVTTDTAPGALFRDSGEPRPVASARTDVVTAVLGLWFTLGLFLDAYAHANIPELESFFTPWHAVFYSGFAAVAAWVLWTVWGHVRDGRRGIAAVPVGYGLTLVALPVFVVAGAADMAWHELLGIETTTDIFFSPSHLGLITAMIVIVTTPLRTAWADPVRATPTPTAVLTLASATSLVLLFLTYGNALLFSPDAVVGSFSVLRDGSANALAGRVLLTNAVLLAPLLLLAKRWRLPFGAATAVFGTSALISAVLTGFELLALPLAVLVAGVLADVLARVLRPAAHRRGAFWGFAAATAAVTWTLYLGVASAVEGRLPAVVELWTGMPIVAALVAWLLAVIVLPTAVGD